MIEIPVFEGNGKEKAQKIVEWVEKRLKTSKLTARDFLGLGTETPAEILAAGKIPSDFGCLNKSALIGALLKLNGLDSFLVSEKVYHKGKRLGIHFLIEATDGKTKFTIDPHTVKTIFFEDWFQKKHKSSLSFKFDGTREITCKKILRKEITATAMHQKCFSIAGINGKAHYLWLSRINPLTFFRFARTRLETRQKKDLRKQPFEIRIGRARSKNPAPLLKKAV